MDYHSLPRKELQLLCKKHGIPANKTNVFMAEALAKKRIPLSDVSVNKEAENDLFSVTPLKVSATKSKGDDGNAALFNNTPFLRRGTKKKETALSKSSDGTAEQVEVSAAAPHRGARLFLNGGCDRLPETSTDVRSLALPQKTSTTKDVSGTLQREESKSGGNPTKVTAASVKQKPEEKSSVQLRSDAGSLHQLETRRGGNLDASANGAKATIEKIEQKPSTSFAATTKALQQPDGRSRIGACKTSAANAEVDVKVEKDGKISSRKNSKYAVLELEDMDSGTVDIRRSSSESSFMSADREELEPTKNVEISTLEAGFVHDDPKTQTCLGPDSYIEDDQQRESEPGTQRNSPKQKYVVKVTFADEVSIMGQGSGGIEKLRLEEESKVRRSDTSSNGVCTVKSKLDPRPATNAPFVFRATREEETRPKRLRRAATEKISDSRGRVQAKPSVAGILKHDETKGKGRVSSEGREAVAEAKGKSESKAAPVSNCYSKPSKRPRLASGSKVAKDPIGIVDEAHSSPMETKVEVGDTFEFPATFSQEFKVLDLPEWAREFKTKRGETLSSALPSNVAHSPDTSPGPSLSPLKRIEDRVVVLLDKLKGFCWKAEFDDQN